MSKAIVHPTAVVGSGAKLGDGVKIGPFCVVTDNVVLHDNVELISHVSIDGHTEIGAGTKVFPFASVGHEPQDRKYAGEASRLEIGERCVIREAVTINPGTAAGGGMLTKIGNDCLLMASAHVAHDCILGNNVIMANYVGLAGHVIVGDNVTFGGMAVVHQFTRVGPYAFIGAQSMIGGDVIPYGMALGNRASLAGLNLVGLKRHKFDREAIHRLRAAYRMIFASEGTLRERVEDAAELFKHDALVQDVVAFISVPSERPILIPRDDHAPE